LTKELKFKAEENAKLLKIRNFDEQCLRKERLEQGEDKKMDSEF